MNNLPLTLDARALAKYLAPLLYKAESTILKDINRRPETLPPPEHRGGKKIWFTVNVQKWLAGEENRQVVTAIRPPALQQLGAALISAVGGNHAPTQN